MGNDNTSELISKSIGNKMHKSSRKKGIIKAIVIIAVVTGLIFVLFEIVFGVFIVKGSSMEPSVKKGSVCVFYRLGEEYERGDIVVFSSGSKSVIKRVAAVPGDVIGIEEETGHLTVNGEVSEGIGIYGETFPDEDGGIKYPYTVGNDEYFVLGDNRESSVDSRILGTVRGSKILGKVVFGFVPY